ncbi:hypothetical protein ACFONN_16265 [Dyella humi]|uniref:Uncharacterized protein n=1 Tax=Dyella humi TaxID=1770547 RepID=A0ABW8IPF7_9GAMM
MEDSLPIWPQHEAFYIQSMLFHTRQACTSINFLESLVSRLSNERKAGFASDFDCSAALDHVQNLVFRAAAVSRYFWPSRKQFEVRGERLRAAFEVKDESALRNRDLRDAAEHFDERLDNYLKAGIVGYVIPEWFGPLQNQEVPTHYFRAYFINTGCLRILDQEFFVQPIAEEIVRVHNLLTSFDENGGRMP